MKRFAALLLTLALFLLGACSEPAVEPLTEEEAVKLFSLAPGEAYTVLSRSDLRKNSEFIERLGYTVSTFRKDMEEGDVFLFAATPDNDRQIQVKCWGDPEGIARKLEDLSYLPGEKRELALQEMGVQAAGSGELLSAAVLEREGQVFFRFRVRSDVTLESEESAEGYCFDEYLTVTNGRFCALLFYNAAGAFSDADETESERLFAAFSVAPTPEKTEWRNFALRVFAAVVLLAASVAAVYILSTFVRDIRHRREQPDSIPDRIKMRRK